MASFESFDLQSFFPWAFDPDHEGEGPPDASECPDGADVGDSTFMLDWARSVSSMPGVSSATADRLEALPDPAGGFNFDWASPPGGAAPTAASRPTDHDAAPAAHRSECKPAPSSEAVDAPRPALANASRPTFVDTTRTLHLPGLQHILSNATESMGNSMTYCAEWLASLKHVCNLLRRSFSKDRLRATCFMEEPASLQWPLFASFSAHIVSNRWGSISHAVCELIALETPLRFAWDLNKFTFNNPRPAPNNNDPERLDIGCVDSAIRSPLFWAYTFMVSTIAEVVNHMTYWLMACPCHPSCSSIGATLGRAGVSSEGSRQTSACPMAGRRAPEVASGEMNRICDELWGMSSSRLRLHASVRDLPTSEQSRVLTDAGIGKHAFLFYFGIKTAALQQLPLKCLGLGCLDWATAREAVVDCLRQYDLLPPGAERHPLVKNVCDDIRDDTVAFANGAAPSKPLMKVMAEARFHTINEACVEGLHSVTRGGIVLKPRFGPNHVALLHHLGPIRRLVGGQRAGVALAS